MSGKPQVYPKSRDFDMIYDEAVHYLPLLTSLIVKSGQ